MRNELIESIKELNKNKIENKIDKLTKKYNKELEEYRYRLNLIDTGIFKENDSLGTIICKLYLVFNASDASKVLNELGYKIESNSSKKRNTYRKYTPSDITEIIDLIGKDKSIDHELKEKVINQRNENLQYGWGVY